MRASVLRMQRSLPAFTPGRGLCALGLGLFAGAAVATTAPTGVRGAEVLDDGAMVHSVAVEQLHWSGDRDSAQVIEPRVRMGLPAGYEIGLSVQRWEQGGGAALRHIGLEAVVPLRGADSGPDVAMGLFGTVAPAGVDKGIGSGDHSLGAAVHFTDRYGNGGATVFHSSFAFERADIPEVEGVPGYRSVNRIRYGARAEQRLTGRLDLTVEASAVLGVSGDEPQNQFGAAVRPGLALRVSPTLFLTVSAGQDIPDRGVEPSRSVRAELVHRPRPPVPRRELLARLDTAEATLARTEEALEHQRMQHALQAGRMHQHRDRIEVVRRKAGSLDVEVVNLSGYPGLGARMAQRLRGEGHYVVRIVERGGEPGREITGVAYRHERFADEAEALGGVLAATNDVYKEPALPGDTEVRILVGRDQWSALERSDNEAASVASEEEGS